MSEPVLLVERRGVVEVLTMNRREVKNALDVELVEALTAAALRAAQDDGARAVVLTGAGGAFSAGADLKGLHALQTATPAENAADGRRFLRLLQAVGTCPKPVVGVVDGPALAGGCGVLSCCDFILASPESTFGYPEVKVGFVAAMVLVLLARQLGERRARELVLSGVPINADKALAWGLVHHVMPSEALLDEAVSHARQLAAGAPSALALTKELLWRTSGLPLGSALELAAQANVYARTNPEMKEGLEAFLDKRRPGWKPR